MGQDQDYQQTKKVAATCSKEIVNFLGAEFSKMEFPGT